MIQRIENGTLLISDSGVYEPPIMCPRILRRRRYVKIVSAVLAIAAVIFGALAALSNWEVPQI